MQPTTTTTPVNTSTFQTGDTASGVAAKLGMTPEQFLSYNPDLKATGRPNDYKGLTGLVNVGQTYNTGPQSSTLINTSTTSRTNFNKNSSDLDRALANLNTNPTTDTTNTNTATNTTPSNDPFMTSLDELSANQDAATKSLIASTKASYQNQVNATTKQFENYKAGLQQLGVQTGAAEATPDLLAGHIQQAGADELDKIRTLDVDLKKALSDATLAKANNDFKTVSEKMNHARQLQSDKVAAIKNAYDTISNAGKQVVTDSPALYQSFKTLNPDDAHNFIMAIADKYKISPLTVQSALLDEQSKEQKTDISTQNTQSIIAKRNQPKSVGSTKPVAGTGGLTQAQIDQGNQILKTGKGPNGEKIGNPQGSDGYVDPSVYLALYNEWKGNNATFLKAYPIGQVNPKSIKLLPEALRPKSSRTV